MKKLYILFLIVSVIVSCSSDDNPPAKDLATPSLTWNTSNVTNNILAISITISSAENLPSGKIEFKIDNDVIDNFTAVKGTRNYTTSYTFNDTNDHSATIVYSFTDRRTSISKTIVIRKILNETKEKSIKDDWIDF